jgi:HAD superfamily hydrolase (TIGR01484 family)
MKSLTSNNSHINHYRALMLDVDGTTIINNPEAMPTNRVKESVLKAHGKIKIGLATSRPFWHTEKIINVLKINAPCILIGGAQIYDPLSKKIVWEKLMDTEDVKLILKIAENLNIEVRDDGTGRHLRKEKIYLKNYLKKGPPQFWTHGLDPLLAEEFIKRLSVIPTIAVMKAPSWKTGMIDVIISHALATKQHGIIEVSKLLNIATKDIIGVGDGYNDFPLLMACGLKIAMGNADSELKKIADFIAPTVEEDGVATVIEKFIL